ncbi:NUDIX domain-containing protein [Celerinatantimonas yamalensis]
MNGYRLPGGHIELGEKIETAIIREALEKTGVQAEFQSILGFTT